VNRQEAIQYVKDKLDNDPEFYDYSVLASILQPHVEPCNESLQILAELLSSGTYGCSRNDVQGLVDLMEGG
jgi:hypothetical protein